jgi:hypothetical protein
MCLGLTCQLKKYEHFVVCAGYFTVAEMCKNALKATPA